MTNNERYSIGISLSKDQHLWLKSYAEKRTVSIAAAIRLLIDEYRKPEHWLEYMNNRLKEEK